VLLNGAPAPQGQQMSIDDMTVALIKQIQQRTNWSSWVIQQPLTVGGVEGAPRSCVPRRRSPTRTVKRSPNATGWSRFRCAMAPDFHDLRGAAGDFDRLQPTTRRW
jgi:hypothetical protein